MATPLIREANIRELSRLIYSEGKIREGILRGAMWFFLIPAVSLISSILMLTNGERWIIIGFWTWALSAGLGVNQWIDSVAWANGGLAAPVAAFFDIAFAGAFGLCGIFALRYSAAIYLAGMIAYALDGLIVVMLARPFGFVVHVLALGFLINGYLEVRKFRRLCYLEQQYPEVSGVRLKFNQRR